MTAKRRVIIRPEPAVAVARAPEPTVWQTYSFAPEWFADALGEARTEGHDSRRREIVSSVCFAESRLAEWVRDEVLKPQLDRVDWDRVAEYYRRPDGRFWQNPWNKVPEQLLRNNLIPKVPDLGGSHGAEWKKLMRLRNGLVHAKASLPDTRSLPKEKRPEPSKTDLDKLQRGWALRIAIERVKRLHEVTDTPHPPWLVEP